MQHGPNHPFWMQWIPCSVIECRGFHALWRNGSRFYAVESMHCDWMQCNPCSVVKCIPIECSELNAAWLNAVYNMHREEMEPYWMQWFFYSMNECRGYYGADIMQHDWMQCILCSMAESIPIECSGFHAASLNAEDSMQRDIMQWSPCSQM